MAKKNQVARNERERNRVHQVNHGFDVLRNRLQPKNHTKKWSKADTLREAVRYIQQLQELLNKDSQQSSGKNIHPSPSNSQLSLAFPLFLSHFPSFSVSSPTSDYSMNHNNFNSFVVKEEFAMYLPPTYHQTPSMPSQHGDNSHNFNSPTSSISSSSYSPTQMCYPPVSYSNYPHQ
ncbi:CRE-HLH-14 protein [Caenorhabditis remanei]|uniref:CRE-HLH-14 protein n=1 Tax=Caenorhabditis remanei TaxID=31234 RepID=E3M4V3_CAERE|nr:CRE-HLH-14 protein [Caenorhabditis remanei]